VKLKIQEIYLALIAEQSISKEDIMEYYLNRIWFGSGGNTRGITKSRQNTTSTKMSVPSTLANRHSLLVVSTRHLPITH